MLGEMTMFLAEGGNLQGCAIDKRYNGICIRDFAFQWDSDIKDLCTQNKQAKSGIPREKLSLVFKKMCVHECL